MSDCFSNICDPLQAYMCLLFTHRSMVIEVSLTDLVKLKNEIASSEGLKVARNSTGDNTSGRFLYTLFTLFSGQKHAKTYYLCKIGIACADKKPIDFVDNSGTIIIFTELESPVISFCCSQSVFLS